MTLTTRVTRDGEHNIIRNHGDTQTLYTTHREASQLTQGMTSQGAPRHTRVMNGRERLVITETRAGRRSAMGEALPVHTPRDLLRQGRRKSEDLTCLTCQ